MRVPLSVSTLVKKKGVLNCPGITAASKRTAEDLLREDAETHHCYFRLPARLHNHLGHHVLSAYDLGAPPAILTKVYDKEAATQRSIYAGSDGENMVVTEDNWTQYIGNPNAYGAFVKFFDNQVKKLGILAVLETYVFSAYANERGTDMVVRLVTGIFHSLIQIGYGLEFGIDSLVVTGLSQTAVNNAAHVDALNYAVMPNPKASDISLLDLLRQIYESDTLTPPLPYDPNALYITRIDQALTPGRISELQRLLAQYPLHDALTDAHFNEKADEFIWASTLITFGTGRPNRAPRLDFFFMHLSTSSVFLPIFLETLTQPSHKVALLRAYLSTFVITFLSRGRPCIRPELVMAQTAETRPPSSWARPTAHPTAVGSMSEDGCYNPWPLMVHAVIYSPDAHTIKTMRTLMLAAQRFGWTPVGGAPGAYRNEGTREETLEGMGKVDGTLFVRAAGMLMDYMGWPAFGEKARSDWDRSALGWDEAWLGDD